MMKIKLHTVRVRLAAGCLVVAVAVYLLSVWVAGSAVTDTRSAGTHRQTFNNVETNEKPSAVDLRSLGSVNLGESSKLVAQSGAAGSHTGEVTGYQHGTAGFGLSSSIVMSSRNHEEVSSDTDINTSLGTELNVGVKTKVISSVTQSTGKPGLPTAGTPSTPSGKMNLNKTEVLTSPDSRKAVWTKNSVFIDPTLYVNSTADHVETHSILMWNPPGWMSNWYGAVDFNQCSYKNCKLNFNQQELHKSSAVVFSVGDLGMGVYPPVSSANRNPDQPWIFFTLESPVHLTLPDWRSPSWHKALNWSWNYRTDSDIFHPYGILQTRLTPPEKNYTQIFRRKSKMAAWAVSHCQTFSKRERYVNIMKQFTAVDIYGKCGRPYPDNFKQILDRDYKFYLGFENSLCPDYVTEKFFNYYKRDIITVVRGHIDYSRYLPEGSYINAADFTSVKQLTDFMERLGDNEEEYIKYLRQKDKYEVKERDYMFRDALCSICHKLNNLEAYRKTYDDIVRWFGNCYSVHDLR